MNASLRNQQKICEQCKKDHPGKKCIQIKPCMAEMSRPLQSEITTGTLQRRMPLPKIVTECSMEINLAIDAILNKEVGT